MQKLHDELTAFHSALMKRPDKAAHSFHELMGQWLALPPAQFEFDEDLMRGVGIVEIEDRQRTVTEILDRALQVNYDENPWAVAAGQPLEDYLSASPGSLKAQVAALVDAVGALPVEKSVPRFPVDKDPVAIGHARAKIAAPLEAVAKIAADVRSRWATATPKRLRQARQELAALAPRLRKNEAAPLDAELMLVIGSTPPALPRITEQIAVLRTYNEAMSGWFGFLAFKAKAAAGEVLGKFGLTLSAPNGRRALDFVDGLSDRLVLRNQLKTLGWTFADALPEDEVLVQDHRQLAEFLDFLIALNDEPMLADVAETIHAALKAKSPSKDLIAGLSASALRAERLVKCEQSLSQPIFAKEYQTALSARLRGGETVGDEVRSLAERMPTLEGVLRVKHGLAELPERMRASLAPLLDNKIDGVGGVEALRRASLACEIRDRLQANRSLVLQDAEKLEKSFGRYGELDFQKKQLTTEAIRHHWGAKQIERLLASTGSRLNSEGAEVRRRLMLRGERALRLRQVLALGEEIAGGDPLFDLRPVWMASPETVAQLFPLKPVFDVVIFDEASQCRLEEALPVLMRAKRVVIAGDPKQLPPTRFFESALAVSDEEDEIETNQDLFERQQGEVEDLLSAALNMEIDEAYLDVHYRSRNSDLIEFSNANFYNARLQAIPGHPSNRVRYAPLTLYKVGGVYEERTNKIEAAKVRDIVRDLLKRAEPPSIGIACFNIAQRDLILETLEETAANEPAFAKALAEARDRRGAGAFEGLFVKNLENVQGDERDHIIISTTYGPDPAGRFYRRFGPVGRAGGGRRLNVLVTRARDEVHLVTSIPESVYRNAPPVPPGSAPGGAWLLFAYLAFAETLAAAYERNHELSEQAQARKDVRVQVRETRFPSEFSRLFAEQLRSTHKIGSDVHWGNDGFCVDLALHHPTHADGVTIGVQCDLNRFDQAADPIEWEVFRNYVMQAQGWHIQRVWSPQFFRDAKPVVQGVLTEVDLHLRRETPKDAIVAKRIGKSKK